MAKQRGPTFTKLSLSLLLLSCCYYHPTDNNAAHAFSATPPPIVFASSFSSSSSSGDIKIVGLPGGQVQSLPGIYVKTFRRWIVEDRPVYAAAALGYTLQIEPIPGAGLTNLPLDEGWVNPTTTTELWWPADLPILQSRPLLNVLFRNGIVSYVSIGLDVRVPHRCSVNEINRGVDGDNGGVGSTEEQVVSWRNYGLISSTKFSEFLKVSFYGRFCGRV